MPHRTTGDLVSFYYAWKTTHDYRRYRHSGVVGSAWLARRRKAAHAGPPGPVPRCSLEESTDEGSDEGASQALALRECRFFSQWDRGEPSRYGV